MIRAEVELHQRNMAEPPIGSKAISPPEAGRSVKAAANGHNRLRIKAKRLEEAGRRLIDQISTMILPKCCPDS
jgi:hypothetical protein